MFRLVFGVKYAYTYKTPQKNFNNSPFLFWKNR
jgi:hypothetical protein